MQAMTATAATGAAGGSRSPRIRTDQIRVSSGCASWSWLALVTAAALRAGVAITPGGPYFTAEPPAPHIRMSYAHTDSPERLAAAVSRLRGILDQAG
jgi:DNA-binding transcriptional MocR family regulator